MGVLLVFSFVIFIISSFRLVASGLDRAAESVLQVVPDITVQKMLAGRQVNLSRTELDGIQHIFGIKTVRQRVWGYYFDESNGANYTVVGDETFDRGEQLPGLAISYDKEEITDSGISPAVLGLSVRESKGVTGRRTFSLFRPDLSLKSYRLAGVFAPDTAIITGDLIAMGIDDARDLFQIPSDQMTDALVSVTNPTEITTIAGKISDMVEGARVITKKQIQKTYRAAFGWRSGFGFVCLFGAVAAFIILAWDKASGLSPDQLREVGILRALGWQASDVMTLRFWESAIVVLLGFFLGYSGGWVHVLCFDGALFRPLLFGWSVLKPPVSLVPVVDLKDLLLIFSLSVVPYLAATVMPAWRSAMVRPDSVV